MGLGTHNPCFVAWPLELGLGTHNPRFVAWPLELGLGTHNPHFVAWPLELGSGAHNPRFVAWPLELRSGTHNPRFVAWPLELGLGTHNTRFVAWPLELGLGTHNPRFIAWPLELGSGTHNPRFVAWPLELRSGTHNPRFVAWPLELGLGTHNPRIQEVYHNEINEPCAWTLALLYIKRLSKYMERVESGTRLANMRWCHRHIFVVNPGDKEGLHWFVCAFDCRVRWELFTIWVWEPLSSTHLIRPFLLALKKLSLTTKHRALGFQADGWSCGFQSLNIAKLVVEHRGNFFDVPLVPMGAGFVDYMLSIVTADRAVQVVQAPGDDVEGVTELPGPP